MSHVFNISKDSNLPYLTMELNNDGRYDFRKFYNAIQNATVKFTMWNHDTGIKKIANAPADVVYNEESGCEESYLIQYKWKTRDTNECGKFIGQFTIDFHGENITQHRQDNDETIDYPNGILKMPINEELVININDSTIKTL